MITLVIALTAFIVHSCRKQTDVSNEEVKAELAAQQFSISTAKGWFDAKKTTLSAKLKINAQAASALELLADFTPVWDSARTLAYLYLKMSKQLSILLLFIMCLGNQLAGAQTDSTWFRNRFPEHFKYVILPEKPADASVKVTKVTLQEPLAFDDREMYLTVEVYNILFKDRLAAFSLMPSLDHRQPVWTKIRLDTIKDKLVNIKDLHGIIDAGIKGFSPQRFLPDNLKFNNYVLIIKKDDGYYCNATDCITEFFEIINDPTKQKNKPYQINISAPQLTVAEYESGYRKRRGYYSQNFQSKMGFNEEATNGSVLFRSFSEVKDGKKRSNFWIFGTWAHDSANAQRGSERFIFEEGVGMVGASYDFFMPRMKEYWYDKLSEGAIPSERAKAELFIGFEYQMLFHRYLTEYTIPVKTANKP